MPSKSHAQADYMSMCAHDPKHANGKCPPASFAKEFNRADKGTGMITHDPHKPKKRHVPMKAQA